MQGDFEKHSIKENLKVLPAKPGVYQFLNSRGEVIYVGKAKNLKSRVSSYFNKARHENNKIKVLSSQVSEIQHIIVETETDALLLENNLIKKYQPRYNVLLKDDKTFPYICVDSGPFPRVFQTRRKSNKDAVYFGPYTSVQMVKTILELITRLYPLRSCKHNLSKKNIESGKFRVCLEYHVGNCKGPCAGYQSEEEYNSNIRNIKKILRGDIREVKNYLKERMHELSSLYKYEEAQVIKKKLEVLENYRSKSTVVSPNVKNADVFSIVDEKNYAFVNYIKVINGSVIKSQTIEIKKVLDEPPQELLALAIAEIGAKDDYEMKELIVPLHPGVSFKNLKINVPEKGDRKKLLMLSERNAKYFKQEKAKKQALYNQSGRSRRILEAIKRDLELNVLPDHIECFDNSNIQGSYPVSACAVFKNAKPSVKDYRHYNIKTVDGADDCASIKEVIFRRYKRLLEENISLPQLIVIDGGKGQLSAAIEALEELDLKNIISVIAIAKKLEEIYKPGDPYPLYLDKQSETLRTIQYLRNEAHRFGLKLHRQKRSEKLIESHLNSVKGVGPKTIEKLYRDLKTYDRIKQATFEELSESVGKQKAYLLYDFLNEHPKG